MSTQLNPETMTSIEQIDSEDVASLALDDLAISEDSTVENSVVIPQLPIIEPPISTPSPKIKVSPFSRISKSPNVSPVVSPTSGSASVVPTKPRTVPSPFNRRGTTPAVSPFSRRGTTPVVSPRVTPTSTTPSVTPTTSPSSNTSQVTPTPSPFSTTTRPNPFNRRSTSPKTTSVKRNPFSQTNTTETPSNNPFSRIPSIPALTDREEEVEEDTVEEPFVPQVVVLRPWQRDWYERAREIILRHHWYLDTSKMGRGKTFILLKLAQEFGFTLFIVCPVAVKMYWKEMAAIYGVRVEVIISYEKLRGKSGKPLSHPWLNRTDVLTDGNVKLTSFTPTDEFMDLLGEGLMVVFDEVQKLKNTSAQCKACAAISRSIVLGGGGGHSRFALLSATPFDKEEHATNILKLTGCVRSSRMYSVDRYTKEVHLEGMQELIDFCATVDRAKTEELVYEFNPRNKANIKHLAYKLFTDVIKEHLSGSMPDPEDFAEELARRSRATFSIKNGYYTISEHMKRPLSLAIAQLSDAVRYNSETQSLESNDRDIGAVTKAQVAMQKACSFDMARVGRAWLENHDVQTSKLVISVDYHEVIELLKDHLADFNPLILTGKIKEEARADVIRKFRFNSASRVLIMNTAVGGTGLNLQDEIGDYPVLVLVAPGYDLIKIIQLGGRFWRDEGAMSDVMVRMFYGDEDFHKATQILNAMARKSVVVKSTIIEENSRDFVLPGDYESEYENPRLD